ncbi:MAG: hypothetical protein RMK29_11375 [Myxococcales bacterium]|nr:hypothetical protein [Myxococcota bacterium]MDW8282308.1 hypothetical protein [Myxococcales bacterium]
MLGLPVLARALEARPSRRLRQAWEAVHSGQLGRARQLLGPFLLSSCPRRREPARIVLLAAARIAGDEQAMRALLTGIDRTALSPDNLRLLREEEVRVLVALGQTQEAARSAQALRTEGRGPELERASELLAYALLADGRHGAAERVLEDLITAPGASCRRAWALYQLGLLRRRARREAEAQDLFRQAATRGRGTPVGQLAEQALREGEIPERI